MMHFRVRAALLLVLLSRPNWVSGEVLSGRITQWPAGDDIRVSDGTHWVQMSWSSALGAGSHRGYFDGLQVLDWVSMGVAAAFGVTNVVQITDAASQFAFTTGEIGPLCDATCAPQHIGQFVVCRDLYLGYTAVLRIDAIDSRPTGEVLDATWWVQSDGTGDFSGWTAVAPATWSRVRALYR